MSIASLRRDIAVCTVCQAACPLGCRPLVQIGRKARILIIGQAPGQRAHTSGIPWHDPSGDRLRLWLGVSRETFYDPDRIALMPMGFCYPGTASGGDLPPRPECAPLWHDKILRELPAIRCTILIGRFAVARYGGALAELTLAESVQRSGTEDRWILPHPSPRNRRWLSQQPWVESDHLPRLRMFVSTCLT